MNHLIDYKLSANRFQCNHQTETLSATCHVRYVKRDANMNKWKSINQAMSLKANSRAMCSQKLHHHNWLMRGGFVGREVDIVSLHVIPLSTPLTTATWNKASLDKLRSMLRTFSVGLLATFWINPLRHLSSITRHSIAHAALCKFLVLGRDYDAWCTAQSNYNAGAQHKADLVSSSAWRCASRATHINFLSIFQPPTHQRHAEKERFSTGGEESKAEAQMKCKDDKAWESLWGWAAVSSIRWSFKH